MISPTMHPASTSATLRSPDSTPPSFDCRARSEAMTIAAVIAPTPHGRNTDDEEDMRTATDMAIGNFHSLDPPVISTASPTRQPTVTLMICARTCAGRPSRQARSMRSSTQSPRSG